VISWKHGPGNPMVIPKAVHINLSRNSPPELFTHLIISVSVCVRKQLLPRLAQP